MKPTVYCRKRLFERRSRSGIKRNAKRSRWRKLQRNRITVIVVWYLSLCICNSQGVEGIGIRSWLWRTSSRRFCSPHGGRASAARRRRFSHALGEGFRSGFATKSMFKRRKWKIETRRDCPRRRRKEAEGGSKARTDGKRVKGSWFVVANWEL